jgi:heparan-alpha-glucosaminide N-acetyltransferase
MVVILLFINILVVTGGYFHGLRDLSYGVDLDRLRWCGVLQVFVTYPTLLE